MVFLLIYYCETSPQTWLPLFFTDPVGDPIGRPDLHPSDEFRVVGETAMVACDVPLCSEMGRDIMLKGGNAADAAVTVALCIGSINSHSLGIGGGSYIVSTTPGDALSIDARETAPGKAHKLMFRQNPLLSLVGGLAVAVPGELAGLHELYTRHGLGNMTWQDLFEPVIELNRKGWAASMIWTRAVEKMHELVLSKVPALAESWDFIYNGDQLVKEDDWIQRPQLADSLRKIANNGSAAIFYDPEGPFAGQLAKAAQNLGGILEALDFADYRVRVTPALKFNFSANGETFELATTTGASSGLALVAGLNFYSELMSQHPQCDEVTKVHRLIEAMKWTSAARSYLGDVGEELWNAAYAKFSSKKWAQDLLSSGKYSDKRTFPWEHYGPLYETPNTHGTSHFSVVDGHGGAVGMTTTVNILFGSMVYDNVTGIVLNDEMDDFSQPHERNAFNLTPSAFNYIEPHKRPLSLMAPTVIRKDNEFVLTLGCAGGLRIVTAILQAVVRSVFEQMPLLQTIAYPRLHHQLLPAAVMVESSQLFDETYDQCMTESLRALQHDFVDSGALTAMNGIKKSGHHLEGVSDHWRKLGMASGY